MQTKTALYQTDIGGLELLHKGKVRDIYAIDEQYILIVSTDRLSAFDIILPDPIPEKGIILNKISNFWFNKTRHIVPNHLSGIAPETVIPAPDRHQTIVERSIVARKLKPLPIEAIVRGYLIGSGWHDYQNTGGISGVKLPEGLQQAQQLPEIIFTPSTKAGIGEHDKNIDFATTVNILGDDTARQIRDLSIRLYQEAAAYALNKGIIIADTKFEFGADDNNGLILIDEILTPDSSRFWPAEEYRSGISPASFDKQYVRDYLETLDWDKTAPGPKLPADVIEKTTKKYRQAQQLLINSR